MYYYYYYTYTMYKNIVKELEKNVNVILTIAEDIKLQYISNIFIII